MTTTAPMLTSEVSVNIESFQSEPTRARMSAARGSRRKKLASCRADGGHRACPASPGERTTSTRRKARWRRQTTPPRTHDAFHSNPMCSSFFMCAAVMRWWHLGSRPAKRSSSAVYARRCLLTHLPKAGSSANSRGTLAWPCSFTNARSAAKRSSHAAEAGFHLNLMSCSFFMRAALIRMWQLGFRPALRSSGECRAVPPRVHFASRHRPLHLLHAWRKVTVDLGGEWDLKFHTTLKQCLGLGLRTLGGRHGAEMSQPGSIAENNVVRRVFGFQSCAGPCCNG